MSSLPDKSSLHVDTLLTNNSIAFMNEATDFIADKVFPVVQVNKPSDIYPVYSTDSFMRARAKVRNSGEESAGDGWDIDVTNTYQTLRRDFHFDLDVDDVATADEVFNMEDDALDYIMNAQLLTKEETFMTNYFGTTIWDTDLTGVSGTPGAGQFQRWDEGGSNPVRDIRNAALTIQQNTGKRPNTLVVSAPVMTALEENASVVSRIQHTHGGSITTQILAELLRIDRVLIANAVKDDSDAGAALSMAFMAARDGALLCYSAPRPGVKTPSAGYTFAWKLPESGLPISISRFDMPHLKSERIEGSMAYDQRVISSALGVYFTTAIAAA